MKDITKQGQWCHECSKTINDDVVMEIGEEEDWDSATARVCLSCLKKAVKLAEAASAKLDAVKKEELMKDC